MLTTFFCFPHTTKVTSDTSNNIIHFWVRLGDMEIKDTVAGKNLHQHLSSVNPVLTDQKSVLPPHRYRAHERISRPDFYRIMETGYKVCWEINCNPYTFKIFVKILIKKIYIKISTACMLFWRQKIFRIKILTDQLQLIFFDEPSKFWWLLSKFWFRYGLVSNFWINNFLFLVEIEGNSTKIKMTKRKKTKNNFWLKSSKFIVHWQNYSKLNQMIIITEKKIEITETLRFANKYFF